MNTRTNPTLGVVERMALAEPTTVAADANLRRWSELTESMTATVAQHCQGPVSIRLLSAGIGTINSWERNSLHLSDEAYVREIELSVGGIPRLIARSLAAAESPVAAYMQGLAERPLAELLYTDPAWKRAAETIYLQAPNGLPGRGVLWCHHAHQQKLLVEEFFLPGLLQS